MGLMIIGTMSFPLLTGVCYDFYGNYRPAWLVMAAANFAMVPLALRIKPPKRIESHPSGCDQDIL
jgi:cyanate permease